eukprot:scaffold8737_cov96-Skeletonema_marinoi.AAC.3
MKSSNHGERLHPSEQNRITTRLVQKEEDWLYPLIIMSSPGIEPGSSQPQCEILTTVRTRPTVNVRSCYIIGGDAS